MLRVENICKQFNDKKVLSNISFLLKENEILGVSGVSGIGKSTLAKILVNIEEMDSGRVYYNNELILSNSFSIFQDKKIELILEKSDDIFGTGNIWNGKKTGGKEAKELLDTMKKDQELLHKSISNYIFYEKILPNDRKIKEEL